MYVHINQSTINNYSKNIELIFGLFKSKVCLRFAFHALGVDKFYINGLIILKLIADRFRLETLYSDAIELFFEKN